MKKGIANMLGVAVTVALLSSASAAPALASSVGTPAVLLSNNVVSGGSDYTIRFETGKQLKAPAECAGSATVSATPGAWALPFANDNMVFTATLANDVVTLTISSGTVAVVMSGAGTYTAATGVIDFAAAGETATVTATAPADGTWAQAALATVSATAGAYALPVVGDAITFTSALATDDVTLTVTVGAVGVVMSGTGTYTAATGVIDFAAAGETATVTATTASAGTWAQTVGGPTGTAVTVGAPRATTAATTVAAGRPWVLPNAGDAMTFTAAAATDVVTLTIGAAGTLASLTVTMSGTGTWTVATGVITFAAAGETATVTATAPAQGTWDQTSGLPTAAVTSGGTADTITITFPTGTSLANITDDADADCTVGASSGIGLAALPVTPAASAVDATGLKLTVTVPDASIGAAATVQVVVGNTGVGNGVVNPPSIGDHTLTVRTSADTTPVASTPYTLVAQSLPALPGTVELYNPGGIKMASDTGPTAIATLMAQAGEGFALKIGPGTYTENIASTAAKQVFEATGTAAETIIIGRVTLGHSECTLQGLSVRAPAAYGTTVTITGDKALVQNNVFMKAGTAAWWYADAGPETIITYANATPSSAIAGYGTITNNTFDTTLKQYYAIPKNDIAIDVNASGLTISDNTLTVDSATVASTDIAIDVSAGVTLYPTKVNGNTINGPGGTGIRVTNGHANISDTTMSGLGQALKVDDRVTTTYTAIGGQVIVTAGTAGAVVTFALSTNVTAGGTGTITATSAVMTAGQTVIFTAGAGIGGTETIMLTLRGGSATVATTPGTATTSHAAFPFATVSVTDSTISGCGIGAPAIMVNSCANLRVTSNTITGSSDDIIEIQANADNVLIVSNDLSGNARGIDNNDPSSTVNATLNWWGDAAGPAARFNSGLVNTAGYTGTATSGVSTTTTSGTLVARATQGIDVAITVAGVPWVPAAGDAIAVARYTENPQGETPLPALANGFYDVLVIDSVGAAQTEVLIKLYNAVITEDTVAYAWSELQGTWLECSTVNAAGATVSNQGVNLRSGFVWIKVTAASTPSILDLSGTPFSLLEPVVDEEEVLPPAAPTILTPAFGEEAAPVRPTFTWTASPGATSYELVLTQEIGLDDKFAIVDYSTTAATHGHIAREQLKYSTTYNWRVRAVSDVGEGEWTASFFTTMTEPEPEPEPVPPVVVEEIPPSPAAEAIVEVPPTEAQVQVIEVIPDYLLWTVVGVGAVLVIVIIVLIVRPRRIV